MRNGVQVRDAWPRLCVGHTALVGADRAPLCEQMLRIPLCDLSPGGRAPDVAVRPDDGPGTSPLHRRASCRGNLPTNANPWLGRHSSIHRDASQRAYRNGVIYAHSSHRGTSDLVAIAMRCREVPLRPMGSHHAGYSSGQDLMAEWGHSLGPGRNGILHARPAPDKVNKSSIC